MILLVWCDYVAISIYGIIMLAWMIGPINVLIPSIFTGSSSQWSGGRMKWFMGVYEFLED